MSTIALGAPYRRLWSATLLDNLGDGIRAAAFPLLAAALTRDPILISGVAIVGQAPSLLFGLAAGSFADRFDRRRVIVAVDAVRLMLLLGLIAMIAADRAGIVLVYVVVFACGSAEVLRDTTAGTWVPSLVRPEQLDRANGRLVTAEVAGNEFVGPPLGGYLFGVAMTLPFAVNGGIMALAVALVATIPALVSQATHAQEPHERVPDGVRAGLAWLRNHRRVWPILATGVTLMITDTAWFTLLVLYVAEVLGLAPAWYGVLLGLGALGGLAGGMLSTTVSRRLGPWGTTLAVLSLATAGQALLGTTSSSPVTAVVLATSSMAFAMWNVIARTAVQRTVPNQLLGRVNAVRRTLDAGAGVLGAAAGGVAARLLGLHATMLLGVPVLVIGGVVVLCCRTAFTASPRDSAAS